MMGYKWVIRVDTDSRFPAPVPYNLVDAMVSRKAQYGVRAWATDADFVIYGLPEAANYWITAERMRPPWLYEHCNPAGPAGLTSKAWDRRIIFNNFFVANVSWWLQPQVGV